MTSNTLDFNPISFANRVDIFSGATCQSFMAQTNPEVEIPDALLASLTVYNGDDSRRRRRRINEAEIDALPLSLRQGYSVLQAIVHQHLRSTLPNVRGVNIERIAIKIRPTVESRQDQYRILEEGNFSSEVSRVFVDAVGRQRRAVDTIRIPLIVYIPEGTPPVNPIQSAGRAAGRRRATQSRITQAREEITRHLQQSPIDNDSNNQMPE